MAKARKKPPSTAQRVRSALRKAWQWSAHRRAALAKARVGYGRYKCAACGAERGPREVAVDHVEPCGSFSPDLLNLGGFASRLFFGELQVLCKTPCHKEKTARERQAARKKRAA